MAAVAVVRRHREKQQSSRQTLSSMVRESCTNLAKQRVVVMKIGSCSGSMHEDLADMNLKFKFRMNGSTYVKSNARKASTGMDGELRINFDEIAGSAVYEGGESFQFELCRVGLLRSSRTLASCALPAMTVFGASRKAIENGVRACTNESGTKLDLEFIASDTPGKVLANLSVHIGFRVKKLGDIGGFSILRTPSFKLPVAKSVSSVSAFAWNEESQEIRVFVRKARKLAYSLQAIHDATVMAIASRPQDSPKPNQPPVEIADDVSTSFATFSAEESSCGSSTTESSEVASMTIDQVFCQPLLAPVEPVHRN